MKKGSSLKFEDKSSITKTKTGKIIKKKSPKGWDIKTLKPGKTHKFEDGSSITKTKEGKIIRKKSPKS